MEGTVTLSAPVPEHDLGREGIALALGRIEGGQTYIKETVAKIEISQNTFGTVQGEHSVILARHGERLDQHDEMFKDRAPIKHGWPVVASLLVAIAAIISSLLQSFIPHA